ncbi:MAG: GNAT family N-acetyltransferase [Nanoarchaeota archaeon]
MRVRKYTPADRKQVEYIHFETGFLGGSMSKLLSNNDLWKKGITYYLEKEPESIFVLEDKQNIKGYLFGCLDDKKYNETSNYILHNIENLIRSMFLPEKDRIYWRSQFMSFIKVILGLSEEIKFKTPKDAGHIHINLLPEARGKKMGTKLFQEFEKYARRKGVKIIHAGSYRTKINPNTHFWQKNGFKVYSRVRTSMWKTQLPNEKVHLVCYYKKLAS